MTDNSSKKDKKKLIREANDLINLATKVYHYKKDILAEDTRQLLIQKTKQLKISVHESSLKSEDIHTNITDLKTLLEKTGGTFFTRRTWSENAEMFLVAALLAIGIRMYFLQPFKIPTNSMYPTYYGMTYEVYTEQAFYPGVFDRTLRKLKLWSNFYEVKSPSKGNIFLPLKLESTGRYDFVTLDSERVTGRKWLILPSRQRQYTFYIGEALVPVSVKLPAEFSSFDVLVRTYFASNNANWDQVGTIVQRNGKPYLRLAKQVGQGETLLAFEILTGDTLFVDRFSYHFFKPKAGDPFVFRTDEIPGIQRLNENGGKYYIKRIAGTPNDTLEIRDKTLYINGRPATGAKAFTQNAEQADDYEGYIATGSLSQGKSVNLSEGYFYALGDNSDQSSDSRNWGTVPKKAIVGKAAFIFYPFTNRWGRAR